MAPSGPAPAMVGKEMSLSDPVSRRKLSSASTASISVSSPRVTARSNQARKRVAAAQHRAAIFSNEPRDRFRAGRRIEPHGTPFLAESRDLALEGGIRPHVRRPSEAGAHFVAEL